MKAVSANVWAMVDFPVPARPFSQKNALAPLRRTNPQYLSGRLPGTPQTPLSIPTAVPGVRGVMHPIKEGRDPQTPVLELEGRSERRGNEIYHEYTSFVVNILLLGVDPLLLIVDPLLQRGLAEVLDVAGVKGSMHKPDTPSSHLEFLQPDRQVDPRSQCC
jgi:hypothetical protein